MCIQTYVHTYVHTSTALVFYLKARLVFRSAGGRAAAYCLSPPSFPWLDNVRLVSSMFVGSTVSFTNHMHIRPPTHTRTHTHMPIPLLLLAYTHTDRT